MFSLCLKLKLVFEWKSIMLMLNNLCLNFHQAKMQQNEHKYFVDIFYITVTSHIGNWLPIFSVYSWAYKLQILSL